jgi:hypothetical protein
MDSEKGIRIPVFRVKDLKARTVKTERAARVKGGPISWPDDPREAGAAGSLNPAVRRLHS